MNIKNKFMELASKYNLKYAYQDFKNCFGGNWLVVTHSLFNESGCFTIHCLLQRGEIDFYFSKEFSNDRENLCESSVNVFEFEKDIWNKIEKKGFFKNLIFYWNPENILKTIIEVIGSLIQKSNEFFGVKVK